MGAGGWGKNHVRNYAAIPDADLRVILEDPAVAAIVVATHAPFPKAVSATGSSYLQSERAVSGLQVVRALEGGSASQAQGGVRIELRGGH